MYESALNKICVLQKSCLFVRIINVVFFTLCCLYVKRILEEIINNSMRSCTDAGKAAICHFGCPVELLSKGEAVQIK